MRKYCVVLPVFIALVACGHAETPVTKVDRPALTFVIGNLGDSGGTVYSGEVRARHESVLGFRLGGKILARLVDVGAFVKKGQLIARLDQADAQLQQEAAAAQQVLAENELKRYRDLRTKGFVSQSALDVKEASFKQSSAQAGLAGNLAEYTSLTADSDGIVTAVLAEAGQVVSAGQAIVRVAKRGEREVAISIPEAHYAALKIGMPATIELPASQGSTAKYRGRLRELSPAADPASRTYAARVTFSNADRNVALGMTATVQIGTGNRRGGYQVPLTAIFQQGERPAVWVVNPDRSVVLHPVSVSAYSDDGALISAGVMTGQRIVSNGVHKLVAGEKIRIIENGSAQ